MSIASSGEGVHDTEYVAACSGQLATCGQRRRPTRSRRQDETVAHGCRHLNGTRGDLLEPGAVAASAAGAKAAPVCTSSRLYVHVGAIISTPGGTVNSRPVWLPIAIRNKGKGCDIGGWPRVAPVAVTAKNAVVPGSAITSTQYSQSWLRPGGSVYAYVSWTTPVGSSSIITKWHKTCAPAKATGVVMWVVPGKSIVSRHVKVTLPVVCTTGLANLTTEPQTTTAPQPFPSQDRGDSGALWTCLTRLLPMARRVLGHQAAHVVAVVAVAEDVGRKPGFGLEPASGIAVCRRVRSWRIVRWRGDWRRR